MKAKEIKFTETHKADTQKRIESHKTTALQLELAVKHHQDAIKHYEAGNPDKAARSVMTAHGHVVLANDIQREETKRQAKPIKD